ncbi:MAG: ester cyclase [Verrucomicrobiae bacterium]|nr:ester cyclase [Verrucomicrobiae bacterium]
MNALETNKAVVRSYVEAFNRGDFAALREIFAPEAEVQGVLGQGTMDKVIGIWQELHAAFGIELTVAEMIAEGGCVAVRYTERGTFRGTFRGQTPTGKAYELVAMEWFELRAGKIQRRWGARDAASQARQIGLPLA